MVATTSPAAARRSSAWKVARSIGANLISSPTAARNVCARSSENIRSGVRPTSHQPVGIAKVVISPMPAPIMMVPVGCGARIVSRRETVSSFGSPPR